jgi:hypothetical protein
LSIRSNLFFAMAVNYHLSVRNRNFHQTEPGFV